MKHCLPPIYGPDITAENWEQRRVQIVRLFEKNVFGRTPRDGFETRADLLYAAEALEGTAKRDGAYKTGQCGISHGFGVAESAKACAGGSDDQQS